MSASIDTLSFSKQERAVDSAVALGTIVISGGSRGLGAALAEAVHERGGTPIIFDRQAPTSPLPHEIVDVGQRTEIETALERVRSEYGPIHAVIANAGIDACGPFERISAEAWERVINVNLIGTASLIRAALPDLLVSSGKIVTIASTLGFRVFPDASAYCASKFGVVGLTRALAREFAGRVGITLLIPGGMRTNFFDGREERYKPGADAWLNEPAYVAQAVLFALQQPPGCEIRELLITPSVEGSWP